MVETIDEGAASLSDDGTVLYSNRSFAEIFDAPLERFIGARLIDFVVGEDAKLLGKLISDAINAIVRGEIRLGRSLRPPQPHHSPHSQPRAAIRRGSICVVATELPS